MEMKTNTAVIIGVIAIVLFGAAFYFNEPAVSPGDQNDVNGNNSTTTTPNSNNPTSTPTSTNNASNLIKVSSPTPNIILKNPVNLAGQARGYWFFEGSAPVRLLDSNGKIIATSYIQATPGEWMTENFVPFKGSLQFATPQTDTGILVFENSNPSGFIENRRELRIPVRFDKSIQTMEIIAYFSTNQDAQTTCQASQPIMRIVPKSVATARTALTELLKGPTEQERLYYGVFTSINPGVKIQSLEVKDGTAYADFDSTLEFQVGGSCRTSAIRSQITNTLKQFPTVQNVVISINGRTEDILQP